MLTDRTQALLAAIEHQIDAGQAALQAEQERVKSLEAENRALKERLLALAELDPMMVSHSHSEDPDGGTRARGLGNLSFRRPRSRPESVEVDSPRRTLTPLQRLTSAGHGDAAELPAAPDAAEASQGSNSAPAAPLDTASDVNAAPMSSDPQDSPRMEEKGQSALAFGAEHEAPSPHALLSQWYKRYPQAFFKGHTRPLKTGIHLDLCTLEPWPEKLVRRALACYVHLPRYLKSVREGAQRVDLVGEDSELVTPEEAKHAKRQLEALQKKQKERDTRTRADQLDRKIGALLAKHGQRDV